MKMQDTYNFNKLAFAWLKNGIWALALAGLYSIILVTLRIPIFSSFITDKSAFKQALIIHVNLSVLVWLISIVCVILSYGRNSQWLGIFLQKISFGGMILMAISPLIGESNPIINNYVPILENVWFIIGLGLFGAATIIFTILQLFYGIGDFLDKKSLMPLFVITKISLSILYIASWAGFILSQMELANAAAFVPMHLDYYYELLFWSGGHILQFVYTQAVIFVWLVLAELWLQKKLVFYKFYQLMLVLNTLAALTAFYGHFAYPIYSFEFKEYFTNHMRYAGGLAPTLICIGLIAEKILTPKPIAANNTSFAGIALCSSLALFFSGGLIGILISGINVSIPAHYHGSIVGISIAFLGFAYVFCLREQIYPIASSAASIFLEPASLPRLPHSSRNIRLIKIQLIVLSFGQLLHISGLALAGGYGVLRKTPNADLPIMAKFYMSLMGAGGLIAIIGGLMFVFICAKMLNSLQKVKIQ